VRFWVFISLAATLAGCARFESKPISPAETAARFEQRTLDNPTLKTFLEKNLHCELANWPANDWDFEMLTLAAFFYQPGLEVARAQWRVAQAETKTAGARPNPTLSVTPEYSTSVPSGLSPWSPTVDLDVPIETAGKRGQRVARARHLSDAARLNLATTFWRARSEVRAGLIEFVAAREREELLQAQVKVREEIGERLEAQAKAGAIANPELTTARVALAKARGELADAQQQLAEARVRLADAIGVPASALSSITMDFDFEKIPAADQLTSADARRAALQSRTDILALLAEYAASESALRLEIAKQYPDVHVSPGYQFDQGDNKWHLGLSAELPVFNHNQGPIAEAEAHRAESAARFEALQAKVIGEIDRGVAVLEVSRKNLAALKSLADAEKTQREIAEAQFKAGATEKLDLLHAQLEFDAASLAELDAQGKFHQSLGALEDAVQRPLEPNTAPPADLTASPQKK
jgi:outer membrane protein TolC